MIKEAFCLFLLAVSPQASLLLTLFKFLNTENLGHDFFLNVFIILVTTLNKEVQNNFKFQGIKIYYSILKLLFQGTA